MRPRGKQTNLPTDCLVEAFDGNVGGNTANILSDLDDLHLLKVGLRPRPIWAGDGSWTPFWQILLVAIVQFHARFNR